MLRIMASSIHRTRKLTRTSEKNQTADIRSLEKLDPNMSGEMDFKVEGTSNTESIVGHQPPWFAFINIF